MWTICVAETTAITTGVLRASASCWGATQFGAKISLRPRKWDDCSSWIAVVLQQQPYIWYNRPCFSWLRLFSPNSHARAPVTSEVNNRSLVSQFIHLLFLFFASLVSFNRDHFTARSLNVLKYLNGGSFAKSAARPLKRVSLGKSEAPAPLSNSSYVKSATAIVPLTLSHGRSSSCL